ncbi:MAG: hypothetical protein H6Q89_2559, partial [Myxococcaceae bacterium]|nr:hypothetical protein [Myxococcaceae bacterium]
LHRVHHAINPKYLDRNHGGTLMVWDHLFGTWQPEEEQCVYGLTSPLRSYNPVWAQVDGYWKLLKLARHAPTPLEAVKVFFKSPGWRAPWFPHPALPPLERRAQQQKYDPQTSPGRRAWALAQFVLLVLATVGLLRWGGALGWPVKLAAVALIYLGLIHISGLLEGRRWVVPFARPAGR